MYLIYNDNLEVTVTIIFYYCPFRTRINYLQDYLQLPSDAADRLGGFIGQAVTKVSKHSRSSALLTYKVACIHISYV